MIQDQFKTKGLLPNRLEANSDSVKPPSLGEKLGLPATKAPLLDKAGRLGLDSPESLESLAVVRGCWHYRSPDLRPAAVVSESEFSNEELAVVLLSPSLPYSPHTIRIGAAMLGADGNDVEQLAQLVVAENATAPARYIANAAVRFEPDNPFWPKLLNLIPESPPIVEGVMPHPTRFVSMTGMTRAGVETVAVWIRPRPELTPARG